MIEYFPKTFFVTGTDTEVGKTFVSTILTQGLRAHYWKPIQSGTSHPDKDWVQKHTDLPPSHFLDEAYTLQAPLSPHLASQMENVCIDLKKLKIPKVSSHLLIEGCGGVLVPLNQKGESIADLLQQWQIPTLIVARTALGTINHTLLTLHLLRSRGIPLLGVIMNGPKNDKNKEAIEQFGHVPVLGQIEPQDNLSPKIFQNLFSTLENVHDKTLSPLAP